MLPKERRISQALFTQILKNGRSFYTPSLSLRIISRKDQPKSAFSFVISAKEVKNATGRNFLKRRGRHVISKNSTSIKEGYFCAFFLKKELSTLPFSLFEQEILTVLKKANLLR